MKKLMFAAAVAALGVTPALAADMAVKAPPSASTPAWRWAGCYVGVNGGYGWNDGSTRYSNDPNTTSDPINVINNPVGNAGNTSVPTPSSTGGAGGLGGGGAGCNWQSQQWVYGLEGDIDGGRISGSQTTSSVNNASSVIGLGPITDTGTGPGATATASEQVQLRWLSTIRGRLGMAIQERVLLFVTGGLALGGVSSQGLVTAFSPPAVWSGSHSTINTGIVIGGGAEWAFADRWTAKAEYVWYDLGNVSHPLNCASSGVPGVSCSGAGFFPTLGSAVSSIHGSIIRFGINYKLN